MPKKARRKLFRPKKRRRCNENKVDPLTLTCADRAHGRQDESVAHDDHNYSGCFGSGSQLVPVTEMSGVLKDDKSELNVHNHEDFSAFNQPHSIVMDGSKTEEIEVSFPDNTELPETHTICSLLQDFNPESLSPFPCIHEEFIDCGSSQTDGVGSQNESVTAQKFSFVLLLPPQSTVKQQLFKDTVVLLSRMLPHLWKAMEDNQEGLHIMKFAPGVAKIVQRSLYLDGNFQLSASFHGQMLAADHYFHTDCKTLNFKAGNASDMALTISQAVARYRLLEVCQGVPNLEFKSLWHKDEGCIVDVNPFKERRYSQTCRSKKCCRAVSLLQKRCEECSKVFDRFSLKGVLTQLEIFPKGTLKLPSRFKPNKFLCSPEKQARLRRFGKDISNLKR